MRCVEARFVIWIAILSCWFVACDVPETTTVVDLQGVPTDPLATTPAVLVFTRSDCPISNRYAPEVQRLARRFAADGVTFWLVYVDPDESAETIRAHQREYGYRSPAVRDLDHELVQRTGARLTPEAALYDSAGRLAYLGRIDDLYAAYDRKRAEPGVRDLEQAILAVLAGRSVETPRTKAVGCYIADLQ